MGLNTEKNRRRAEKRAEWAEQCKREDQARITALIELESRPVSLLLLDSEADKATKEILERIIRKLDIE